jgi:hypothetical protein
MLSAVLAMGLSGAVGVGGAAVHNRRIENAGIAASVLSTAGMTAGYFGMGVVAIGAGPLTAMMAVGGGAVGAAIGLYCTTDSPQPPHSPQPTESTCNLVVEEFLNSSVRLTDDNGHCNACRRAVGDHPRKKC